MKACTKCQVTSINWYQMNLTGLKGFGPEIFCTECYKEAIEDARVQLPRVKVHDIP